MNEKEKCKYKLRVKQNISKKKKKKKKKSDKLKKRKEKKRKKKRILHHDSFCRYSHLEREKRERQRHRLGRVGVVVCGRADGDDVALRRVDGVV